MLLLRLPGVSCPDDDTAMLLDCVLEQDLAPGAKVLDLGTDPGLMAGLLEQAGAEDVSTIDLGRRLGRARLRSRRMRDRFDLVVANVPFLACGVEGRGRLDRICRAAPRLLAEGGALWLVQSELCDPQLTLGHLAGSGLQARIVERGEVAFGPAMWSRAAALRAQGRIGSDQCTEDIVVIRATRS